MRGVIAHGEYGLLMAGGGEGAGGGNGVLTGSSPSPIFNGGYEDLCNVEDSKSEGRGATRRLADRSNGKSIRGRSQHGIPGVTTIDTYSRRQ